ncbi:MAG: hypothetical protein H0V42_00995 [Nocardioidaceae bacterium]|nr:hypothetical protein [Nocardioidaceae bacterium]
MSTTTYEWLLSMPGGNDDANPYPSFIKTVGAIAMGATTHRDLAPQAEADIRFTRAPAAEVHAEMVQVAGD